MKYTVGAYTFDVPKFKSNDEAVKFIQKTYPHLTEDEIVNHLNPKIEDVKPDKSGDAPEKIAESNKGDTENNRRGVSKNEARRDKQG